MSEDNAPDASLGVENLSIKPEAASKPEVTKSKLR